MNTQSATPLFSEALTLFGDISNNLVYITEELPSLRLTPETSDRIVSFATDFLECLVEVDKKIQRLLTVVDSSPSRTPENAGQILEAVRSDLWKNIQTMHTLVTDFRSRAKQRDEFTLLSVLLNESGANILRDFVRIQDILEGIIRDWKQLDACQK